jgi:UPF0716 protein FxsA
LGVIILLLTIAEVVTIVACVKLLGFWATLGLTLLAMVLGSWLLRVQGLKTADRLVGRLEVGEPPMDEAWDGFCLILAAFLLIIPGLMTDLLALLLFIPPLRRLLRTLLDRTGSVQGHYWFDAKVLAPTRNRIIETTYQDVTPPSAPR